MINVLFVCLGNICRSPLAEAIFKKKVAEKGLQEKINADSSGTGAYHIGENPDKRSIEVAEKNNVPIDHKGQQFNLKDGDKFEYILAMDKQNHRDIIHELADRHDGLFLMRDFDPEAKGVDVPDPYFGGADGFDQVYKMLDRSINHFLEFIIQKHHL